MIDLWTPPADGNLLLVGDVHGVYDQLARAIQTAYRADIDTVVQLGDFGIWTGPVGRRFLDLTQQLLDRSGVRLLFVDGNHENFDLLYTYPVAHEGHRYVRDNIVHLPRGLKWEWEDVSFLAMGGAHSVDRPLRPAGISWWPQEWITDEEIARAQAMGRADVMLCHDSPAQAPNSVVDSKIGAQYFHQSELDLSAAHRTRLAQVAETASPYALFHGHYHRSMQSYWRTPAGHLCWTVGLDEGAAPLKHHTYRISLDDFRELKNTTRDPRDVYDNA